VQHFRTNTEVVKVMDTGVYQNVTLRGNQPNMGYVDTLIDGLATVIQSRFDDTNEGVLTATQILNFSNWPDQSSEEFKCLL